jgi:hypothetical protein
MCAVPFGGRARKIGSARSRDVTLNRDEDDERKARADALLSQAREVRDRAQAAATRARELIEHSKELALREERRQQRERLLRRATEAVKIAKADTRPAIRRFPSNPKAKRARAKK